VVGCATPGWVDCPGSDPESQWLMLGGAPGSYTVQTAFTIHEDALLDSVALSGRWSSHNDTVNVLVNGVPSGHTTPFNGSSTWHALEIDAQELPNAFVHGANTLAFVVNGAAGTAGLRTDDLVVEYDLPEPRLASGLLAALPLLAWLGRRRRSS